MRNGDYEPLGNLANLWPNNHSATLDAASWWLGAKGGVPMAVIFVLAGMLAFLALGFVLGRIWEIRQDLSKAKAGPVPPVRGTVASQLNNRFWGDTF
jgi:hypothetical protein